MKSPMIVNANYIETEEKGRYSELKVLQSAAGYYVGTVYHAPEGWTEPGSRDSDYFATAEAAEGYLKLMTTFNTGGRDHP